MGKKASEIVGNLADKIIAELNRALADEWLAYLQYWNAAKIIKGKMAGIAAKELDGIAKEELEHATELADRIVQLGGNPVVDPKEYYTKTNCGYEVPSGDVKKALEAGVKGERCAIDVYKKIADMVKDKDEITYELILHIMKEEMEHEQKFENLLEEL